MTKTTWLALGSGGVLLAMALAIPAGGVSAAPVAALWGGGAASTLGCILCGAMGLYAVMSGVGLGTILWSMKGFAAGVACIGMCADALL